MHLTQGVTLRWQMEPLQGSQIKLNLILQDKPNTPKGLHMLAMGNTIAKKPKDANTKCIQKTVSCYCPLSALLPNSFPHFSKIPITSSIFIGFDK